MKRGDKVFIVCLLVECVLILNYERLNHKVEKTVNVHAPASVHHIPWETRSGASNLANMKSTNQHDNLPADTKTEDRKDSGKDNTAKNEDSPTSKNVNAAKNGNNTTENGNDTTKKEDTAKNGNNAVKYGNNTAKKGNSATRNGNDTTKNGNNTAKNEDTAKNGNNTAIKEDTAKNTAAKNVDPSNNSNNTAKNSNNAAKNSHTSTKNGNSATRKVDTTAKNSNNTTKNGNNTTRKGNNAPLISQDNKQAPEKKRVFSVLLGRLGNVLFNLASGYGIARTNGRRFVLTPQFVKRIGAFLNTTELPFEVCEEPKNLTDKTVKFGIYNKHMEHLPDKDIRVGQYLQAWQYFMPYESSLRALLRINSSLVSTAQGFLTRLGEDSAHRTFIGVHIRQGDYVLADAVSRGRLTPGPAYMRKAMGHYLKMYPNVTFIVCSDSIAWCKQNMDSLQPNGSDANYELYFSNFTSAEQDMALLAQCNHTIMTVGTYGWWAGWLAGGNVIYFKHPFREGSGYDSRFRDADHFLPRWIGMDDMESNTTDSS